MSRIFNVTVIIPTYNRAPFLGEAIGSVLAQTYGDFELIVVDDGSTDNTQEVLSVYTEKVVSLRTEHAGPSAARNHGILRSRGEYIAFLDSDDLWLPDKLKTQVDFFRNSPDAVICQTEEIWIRNNVRVNPMNKHKKYSGWIFEHCLPLCIVSPSAVMMHRTVFDRVGLFDEAMPACEDYDLWLRISSLYKINLIDKPMILKRGGHADQQSRTIASLDKLRIHALGKILESGTLTASQHERAFHELEKKCRIYGNGCLKRGREKEGKFFIDLPRRYSWREKITL
ncbi:MAG: glycosyltransferase [Pseudomonadota bacterium]